MVYLEQFKLPSHETEDGLLEEQYRMSELGYTDNSYPCNLFLQKQLHSLDFKEVTILYGGNGSGKSTLLNLITNKLSLKRVSPFNSSNIFDSFTEKCDYRMGFDDEGDLLEVPDGSRIITSDDVFDYMLNVRVNNKDIADNVMATREHYKELVYKKTVKMRGMQDYEDLRDQIIARKTSGRQYVFKENGKEVRLNSNGETALKFFYEKLKDDTLFLLDEPENSLSPRLQIELADMIKDMARYCGCQFIIATHSPFMLAIDGAKIFDLDDVPVNIKKWWELENPKIYFDFFNKHKDLFI
ncbi:MAG: AAA family ATPase [Clostridiales bacterium]|nr:AAA family ATPase [Clostridiales bacterium]